MQPGIRVEEQLGRAKDIDDVTIVEFLIKYTSVPVAPHPVWKRGVEISSFKKDSPLCHILRYSNEK
jgi:hypothetical protein